MERGAEARRPEVTLVEFFDYACPYCKASNPAVDRLLQEDKGLRVVYRELPILGPDSVTAARLSLEASKLGRFGQFHDTLWATGRPAPDTNAKRAPLSDESMSSTPASTAGWFATMPIAWPPRCARSWMSLARPARPCS